MSFADDPTSSTPNIIISESDDDSDSCSFYLNITEEEIGYSNIIHVSKSEGVRTGLIYSLLSPVGAGNLTNAAEWGALLAVQDFNLRNLPPFLTDESNSAKSPGIRDSPAENCNFRLRIRFDTYSNLMGLGADFQKNVMLLNDTYQQPMAILGALSSETSALLATLGAVAVKPYFRVGQRCDDITYTNPALRILNISPSSSSAALEDRNRFPYFARTIPSNTVDAEALCRYLASIGVSQLAVLYRLDIYSGQFYDMDLTQVAAKHDITLHGFPFGDFSASVRQAVDWLYETPLRYVYCVGQVGDWNHLLHLLHRYGMLGRGTSRGQEYAWFFGASLALEIQARSLTVDVLPHLNGTAVITLQLPDRALSTQHEQFETASKDASFRQMWIASHSQTDDPASPLLDDSIDWEAPKPTLLSLLTYDSVLALGYAACQVNATRFPSIKIYEKLRGLTFSGMTGEVELDQATASRMPYSIAYSIQNIFYDPVANDATLVESIEMPGGVDAREGVSVRQPLVYSSGSTVPPEEVEGLPVKSVQGIPPRVLIFLWMLIAIALLFSVACAVWTVWQRNHPKFRAAQPIFLFCLCCGTFLVAFSTIFVTWGDPMPVSVLNAGCIADPWFLSIGLTTIFAALFSKVWRIDRVYRNARAFRRVTVRPQDVLWPFLTLLAVNLVILIVWTLFFPIKWTEIVLEEDPYGRVTSVRFSCYPQEDTYKSSMACLYTLIAVSAFALLLLNVESYRARHLPSEFNESTYIGITNLVLLEAMLISVPLIIALRGQRAGFVATRTLLNFVVCLGVLLPTFIPKFTMNNRAKEQRFVRTISRWDNSEAIRPSDL